MKCKLTFNYLMLITFILILFVFNREINTNKTPNNSVLQNTQMKVQNRTNANDFSSPIQSTTFPHLPLFDRKHIYSKDSKKLDNLFKRKFYNKNQIENLPFRKIIKAQHETSDLTQPIEQKENNSKNPNFNNTNVPQNVMKTKEKENSELNSTKNLIIQNPKKNETSDININTIQELSDNIEKINEETTQIYSELCSNEKNVSKSLNKLSFEFHNIQKKIRQSENLSRDQLIIKYTKTVNHVNLASAELVRLEDIINTLKNSNCNKYEEIYHQFFVIKVFSEKLIINLNRTLKKENLNLKLLILED